ncbi:hypothetical protein LIER_35545 [Lithospermum erythrorhizon]|uniref:Phosphoglycerate mutase n=1 Tax=Lithospermum erythrorhizon TaxID=34254 RepID=A0AAV3NWZ1_LITER
MGASQSTQMPSEDEEQEEEEEDDGDEHEQNLINHENGVGDTLVKRVLEQEPEMLPCHASASPLSPQLSTYGTPRIGPSIKVFDPYNVLAPPQFSRSFSGGLVDDFSSGSLTEVYLICHGECHVNLRDGLVWGRSSEAKLTSNGSRQARALGVFLKSQGVRFSAVYSSPLDRARATAVSICQEMNLSEDQIHSSEALVEMSQGHWEGCHRSDIFTSETMSLMDRFQPDFCAPSGESLRQVEFRMIQFLNETVLFLPDKFRSNFSPPNQSQDQYFSNVYPPANTIPDRDVPSMVPNHSDYSHRNRPGFTRKKSGKSRLQVVTGDQEADDEMSPRQPINHVIRDVNVNSIPSSTSCIGVFTHSVPIKCVITGLLGCSPVMSQKICIEDSSVTVLQHSWKTGWQIKRINDTAHLRLL